MDAHAGRGDVNILAEVAECGKGIVIVLGTRRLPFPTRLAIDVGKGGDGDDFLVGGRYDGGRVLALIAGRDDDG